VHAPTRSRVGGRIAFVTPLPSVDATRLTPERYVEALDNEVEAMLAASDELARPIPSCPGWTVLELLSHVVGVYRHKVVALDTDAEPARPDRGDWGDLGPDEDPRDALRTAHAELRQRLIARDASDETWTWWPDEQTVGFWQRRMAHETSVHRWDADNALGPDAAAPVAADLAADGIDELLGWLRWGWDDEPQPDAHGQTVLVSTDDHAWTVVLGPTTVEVSGGGDDGSALIAAAPSDLLLHLWGRGDGLEVATLGDTVALQLLRERLAMATS
jgi:uncharacterized protein (TIGR03083 family)